MDRRTFVKGTFGFAVIGIVGGTGIMAASRVRSSTVEFTTKAAVTAADAAGPLMHEGIRILANGDAYVGGFEGADLFRVDEVGATLIRFADGSRPLDEIARAASAALGITLDPSDVASFFLELGQAGYLQNKVLVNLLEIPA